MGDMLGISLFHLLNETYLLPQIMCLFSSTSRTNGLLEWSFQLLLRGKKLPIDIKGIASFFHVSMCPDKMKWCGYAAVMKVMLIPIVSVQVHESCSLFPTIIGRAICIAIFTYLIILRKALLILERGLIKIWMSFSSDNNCQKDCVASFFIQK